MKSKNEKISSTKDLESPSRRNAILTAGAGAVAAVGATGAFSQTNANESVIIKIINMDGSNITYNRWRKRDWFSKCNCAR